MSSPVFTEVRANSEFYLWVLLTLNHEYCFTFNTNSMILSPDTDVTTMKIHLNELRSRFDQAIREGESFSTMKQMHLQIKELESCIKVLEWSAPMGQRERSEPASRVTGERRYRYVEEPPPLL